MIIGLTGYARSGKDTAALLLKGNGFEMYVFSDILVNMLKEQGKEPTKENQSLFGVKLRKDSGCQYILAKILCDRITDFDKNIVISGFRSPEEVEVFREKFGDKFKLIYVDRGFKARFKSRVNMKLNQDDFIKRDHRDSEEMGLSTIIEDKLYDFRIDNNSTVENLKERLFEIIDSINV
ncbi:hypothetical protein KY330_03200 [Candidatus Woesearchaeota archaeon]|nr:hypothetical protein [Candidatus Woesearchaeota archaeon]